MLKAGYNALWRGRPGRLAAVLGGLFCLAVSLFVGISTAGGATKVTKLFVMADPVRVPLYQAYAKSHPNVDLNIQVVAGSDILPKVELAIQSGAPVPDIVFPGSPSDNANIEHIYAADITNYVPKSMQNQFGYGALSNCTINNKLYCLSSGVSPDVLWFDAVLMKQYHYKVPTTWQQFKALGLRAAKEHPGTIVGSFAESDTESIWFSGFECPTDHVVAPQRVQINMSAVGCTRMLSIVDPLLKAGALSRIGELDPAFAQIVSQGKLLMEVAPVWWGDFLLKATWKAPNGHWVANEPLRWKGEPEVTGFLGSGGYFVYKKSQNIAAAADVIKWIATSPATATLGFSWPAYTPLQKIWAQQHATGTDPFYVRNPASAFANASSHMTKTYNWVTYDIYAAHAKTIGAAIQSGKTAASAMQSFQGALTSLATQAGYKVVR